jgi:uncharacterized repeat protein (TIGR01451 family)
MIQSHRPWLALTVVGSVAMGAAACAPEATSDPIERHTAALLGTSSLLATASLSGTTDFAGLTDVLENGLRQNVLGGIGSGLTWAGGTTFLAVPDRGPNATPFPNGTLNDNTASYIARFETVDLALSPAPSGPLPFVLTPALQATTLLYSATPLIYGSTPGLPSAVPAANGAGKSYFTGRSDNFGPGLSTDSDFARIDPEAIRVARDGNTVFVADEYGPYVYQFDRATGQRLRSYQLPDHFAISHLAPVGAVEIATNTVGRVTNKGMEGLAITPDGSTLVGLVQSPLLQDGGDGGRANRIVTIDVASGATHEFVYDNKIGGKAFNSSEIIALNDHQFLIDTRDGKGLGDGSTAVIKQLWAVDVTEAQDVSALSGEATLLTKAVPKKLFLDIVSVLNANGITSTQIPAKIEGLAFGQDVVVNGVVTHTLYVGNDNDFVPDVAGPSRWFVFGFTDAELAALGLSYVPQQLTERGPDLTVTKTSSAATVVTGSSIDYTLSVANNGLVPAGGVVIADLLPAELALTGCASPTGTCATAAGGPTVSFASLAGAGAGTATVSATLSCAVADGTVVVNQASASFDRNDPTPADNAAAAAITAVNPAPIIAKLAVDTPVLWPVNDKLRPVQVSYEVSDNCPGTTCSLAVASSEASSDEDSQTIDAHAVLLRARRAGTGPGRTYSVTVTCKDSGGAISVETVPVLVPHNL